MEKIAETIQNWLKDHKENGTLPDPSNFPYTPLAMTTNGTSGIFEEKGRRLYFCVESERVRVELA